MSRRQPYKIEHNMRGVKKLPFFRKVLYWGCCHWTDYIVREVWNFYGWLRDKSSDFYQWIFAPVCILKIIEDEFVEEDGTPIEYPPFTHTVYGLVGEEWDDNNPKYMELHVYKHFCSQEEAEEWVKKYGNNDD